MKTIFLLASLAICRASCAAGAADYPMAGISAVATVAEIEAELPSIRETMDRESAELRSAGLEPMTVEAADKCFLEFSVVTDTGEFLTYKLQSNLGETPKYTRVAFNQCTFDPDSKVETCKGTAIGDMPVPKDEFYFYPDPAERLTIIVLESRADLTSYRLNPALVEKDALVFLSCDRFSDLLLSHVDSGKFENIDLPAYGGTVVRRFLTDEKFAAALRERVRK